MGIETGYKNIDNITGVLSDLICIASRPTAGKETLILNIVSNVIKQQIPTLIFSLDNSRGLIKNRIMNVESTISSNFVETARNLLLLEEKLYICDNILNISDIERKAVKLKLKKDIGLIVIDYLQLIKSDTTIEDTIKRLKALAKELNIPVIVLSQLSKELESREDKRPVLSDLKNSSAIVNYADTIMFVYRDDFYDTNCERKGIVDVIIAKTIRGITGIAELLDIKNKYVNLD